MSQVMSTNSTVYLDLKQTPKIANSRKMDADLLKIIKIARENRKSNWRKLVEKIIPRH